MPSASGPVPAVPAANSPRATTDSLALLSRDREGASPRISTALLSILCALALLCPPAFAAKKKKKPRRPAPPAVSATARAAAARRVDEALDASAANSLSNPAALVPFFEQLYQLKSGATRTPVHIIHYGDSHTAADEWTGGLRDLFQTRFGDGGSGFSLAGHPFLGYRRFDARGGGTTAWKAEGLRTAAGDGYFGLGGVSITATRTGQFVYLDTECQSLELHYLQQPDGGDVALYDFDQLQERFSTAGELAPGFVRYQIAPGTHRFRVVTLNSRPVRLFGWVADKDAGVTYEALGINGAEAGVILKWDAAQLATYMQRRNPALVVLAYGTNEAGHVTWTEESYRAMFASLLARVRSMAPAATILVIGPGDRMVRAQSRLRPMTGIDRIVAAQKSACKEFACVYWDTRQRMGGEASMRDWVYAGFGQGDYVHFTATGYRKLAQVLFSDLMRQYASYEATRVELEHQDPNEPRN